MKYSRYDSLEVPISEPVSVRVTGMTPTTMYVGDENTWQPERHTITYYAPLVFHQEEWQYVQNEGYRYFTDSSYYEGKDESEIMNKLYYELSKLPGDIVYRVISKALSLDIENKEFAAEIYKVILNMRIQG